VCAASGGACARRHLTACLFSTLLAGAALVPAPTGAQQSCESLASLRIPNVTITLAKAYNARPNLVVTIMGTIFGPMRNLEVTVPVCRFVAFAAPTSDSNINFEVWLPPAASRNGKFEAVGNPGFIGSIGYKALSNRYHAVGCGFDSRAASRYPRTSV
jgi:feruloyl esterase